MMHKRISTIVVCLFLVFSAILTTGLLRQEHSSSSLYTTENKITTNNVFLQPTADKQPTLTFDWWPMFSHDAQHTGLSTTPGPNTNKTLWAYAISPTGLPYKQCSAAVVNNRFYTSSMSDLLCLNASGNLDGTTTLIWDYSFPESHVQQSPAVINDRVYVGTTKQISGKWTGIVYCLNATGNPITHTTTSIWKYTLTNGYEETLIYGAPLYADGKILIATNSALYCLDAMGDTIHNTTTLLWKYSIGGAYSPSPAYADGKIYFAAGSMLFCLDAVGDPGTQTTALLWNYSTVTTTYTPVIANNRIFLCSGQYGTYSSTVYCLDADPSDGIDEGISDPPGSTSDVIWTFSSPGFNGIESSPAVANDKLYFGSVTAYGTFYCLNAFNGSIIWSYSAGNQDHQVEFITPAAITNEKIFVISSPAGGNSGVSNLLCLNATGNQITHTTTLLWKYTPLSPFFSPALADGKLFVGGLCFKDQNPPAIPDQPQGPIEGSVGQQLTFTTHTVDSDNLPVQYKWNFGVYTTGWLGPHTSGEETSVSYSWMSPGTYDVKVKAKNSYNKESDWSSPLTITISTSPTTLVITAPSPVVEGTPFLVTVTAGGTAVQDVSITFSTVTYSTNSSGIVKLTAPLVTDDSVFTLTASHEGYITATKTITVLNQPEQLGDHGWVFGVVYNTTGEPVEGATVCILLSSDETGATRQCTLTNDQGRYNSKPTLTGTYTVEITKDSYTSVSKQVTILKNLAQSVDFTLEKSESPNPTTTQNPMDYVIEYGIQNNIIGAQITIPKQEPQQIAIYNTNLEILGTSIEKGTFQFTITGTEGTQGTVIALRLNDPKTVLKTTVEDLKNLEVTFDGQHIEMASTIGSIFSSEDSQPRWIGVFTEQGVDILVYVPHFSEHTIIISTVVEALGGIAAVMVYVALCVIAGLIFLSHALSGPVIQFLAKKKGK
jgi:hypothetical protein